MLAAVFSFRGRINRLQFFAASMGLFGAEVVMFVIAIVVGLVSGRGAALIPVALIAVAIVVGSIWIGLSLHARRVRDVGLDPVIVIPMLTLVIGADRLVAQANPAIAFPAGSAVTHGLGSHTLVGNLILTAYVLFLLFWPGRRSDAQTPTNWADNVDLPNPSAMLARASAPMRAPGPARAGIAAAPAQARPAGPTPFGRRGL